MSTALLERIVLLGRYLRDRGFALAPADGALMLEAAATVGLLSRGDLKAALGAVAVRKRNDRATFEAAFELFFGSGSHLEVATPRTVSAAANVHGTRVGGAGGDLLLTGMVADRTGASYAERLTSRDFAELDEDALAEVKRQLAALMWRPADARSRRWRPAPFGSKPDLRRSLRSWVGPEGDLMLLARRERRPRRRPTIVIGDVSGSMERYVDVFLSFMHAARSRLGRMEAFLFATRLTRITPQLARRELHSALTAVAREVEDWSGGTRIGEALETFNRDWSRRVTRGGPVCIVISDGWDRGDPQLLRTEMARLARSVHRVVWLNPLAGRPGYEPATRGMTAVLPHIDDLLPAATLDDVGSIIRLLESIPARR